MKSLNFSFVLVLLCGFEQICHGENLNCEFESFMYNYVHFYACHVKSSLDNTDNNMVITGHSGSHQPNKNDTDVKAIWIEETNTKFIPTGLGLLFNLSGLYMWNTQLVEIKSTNFIGMQNLIELDLSWSKLTSLPVDAFSTLPKLKRISLYENLIEEIPNGVFANNLQLENIHFKHNRIKFIGSKLFAGSTKLDYFVDFERNVCINKKYRGTTQIGQLQNDIQNQCKNPNELSSTTEDLTTTSLTPTEID